ncbi:MAG: hypothetical protein PVG25_11445 [Anaerolineae bacterium]|jgi:hypothetical protein
MTTSLGDLIAEHREPLVDSITKDAIRQIPSYSDAPLRLTMERIERWLEALSESIRRNDPSLLSQYLMHVGEERKAEGYPISELHAIVHCTECHVRDLVARSYSDPVERNGQTALLTAVMDSARMTLSVAYIIRMAGRDQGKH